jgi:hypothetical protein
MEFPERWDMKDILTPDQNTLMDKRGGFLGEFINDWRRRSVAIYLHQEDNTKVITVGTHLDVKQVFVCVEDKKDYEGTLQRIADAKPGKYIYH